MGADRVALLVHRSLCRLAENIAHAFTTPNREIRSSDSLAVKQRTQTFQSLLSLSEDRSRGSLNPYASRTETAVARIQKPKCSHCDSINNGTLLLHHLACKGMAAHQARVRISTLHKSREPTRVETVSRRGGI